MFADAGPIEVLRGFRRLPAELARLMLGLHALDAGPVEAALRSDGGRGTAQLGADALLADLAVGRGCELSAVRPWLDARRPAPGPTVVCHGDLHALNVLSAGDRVTVVDWELATVGDPALDVARTALILAAVPVEMSAAARRPVQRLGAGAARRFVRAYTEHRPLDPRAVAWYGVLHAARILARLEQRDSASDPVLDAWAPTAPLLRARIERIAGIPIS
jgi:aminoglycoside phosphotransferase (APT) family kinase protein